MFQSEHLPQFEGLDARGRVSLISAEEKSNLSSDLIISKDSRLCEYKYDESEC